MHKATRNLLILAAVLALAASLYIVFSPISYVEQDALTGEEVTAQLSWFEGQGWWGVLILLLFAALYALPLALHLRARAGWAALLGLLALVLTYLAGFSIGVVYWPAAAALILGILSITFRS